MNEVYLKLGRAIATKCKPGFHQAALLADMEKEGGDLKLTYSLDDLRRQFYSIKECNSTCSIGCSRTASAYDEWRAQPRSVPIRVEPTVPHSAPELDSGQLTR